MEDTYMVIATPYTVQISSVDKWANAIALGNGHVSQTYTKEFKALKDAIYCGLCKLDEKITKITIWDKDDFNDTFAHAYLDDAWQVEICELPKSKELGLPAS